MTDNPIQFSMFAVPAHLDARSLTGRCGIGMIAHCIFLVLMICLGWMLDCWAEPDKVSQWGTIKVMPAPPQPLAFTRTTPPKLRPQSMRKAILPDLQNGSRPSVLALEALPAPPVLERLPKQPEPMIQATLTPLPAPPAPKPIVGLFQKIEGEGSIPKPKPQLATGGVGFNTETANSIKQRTGAEIRRVFEEGDSNPAKSRVRQRIQESNFAAAMQARPKAVTDRQVVESTFQRNQSVARTVPTATAALVDTHFDSLPSEAQRERRPNQDNAPTEFKPVEILRKPRPMYTEQARKLGIEGDVRVRVLFGVDGKLKVMGIVAGLGYGLDENAAVAVSQILFQPATRMGEPVEQSAIVRVQFQLAN